MNNVELQLQQTREKNNSAMKLIEIQHKNKIEMENLRHQYIMEEIKAMKNAKINMFVRQIQETENKEAKGKCQI